MNLKANNQTQLYGLEFYFNEFINLYNKKKNKSYSIQFIIVDIFYGIILTNILVFISHYFLNN